jgi:hypothetical protein
MQHINSRSGIAKSCSLVQHKWTGCLKINMRKLTEQNTITSCLSWQKCLWAVAVSVQCWYWALSAFMTTWQRQPFAFLPRGQTNVPVLTTQRDVTWFQGLGRETPGVGCAKPRGAPVMLADEETGIRTCCLWNTFSSLLCGSRNKQRLFP